MKERSCDGAGTWVLSVLYVLLAAAFVAISVYQHARLVRLEQALGTGPRTVADINYSGQCRREIIAVLSELIGYKNERPRTDSNKRAARQTNDLLDLFNSLIKAQEEEFKKHCTNSSTICITGAKGDIGPKGDLGFKGDIGPQGAKGDTGTQGEKGNAGNEGSKGESGQVGQPGSKGEQGLTGPKGEEGQVGAQGLKGNTGAKGDFGEKGSEGKQGEKGEAGSRGDKGEVGQTGGSGPPGPRGEHGTMSPPGPKGESGKDGLKGEQGQQGLQGLKGDAGEKGDTGVTGSDGKPGEKGATGERGEKGDMGPVGQSGPPGPRGDRGTMSPPGPKGEPGLNGLKGDEGQLGLQGIKGERGNKGEPGEKGNKGETGQLGLSGPPGPRGEQGFMSPPGPKGEAGLTGPPGVKGDQGSPGPVGEKGVSGDKGDEGKQGLSGIPGLKGEPGVAGERGEAGQPGASGPPGPKGVPGMFGPKGDVGDAGPSGNRGPIGPQGLPGLQGPEGPKGEQGEKGSEATSLNCCASLSKPTFQGPTGTLPVLEGTDVTLSCDVQGEPPPKVTWVTNAAMELRNITVMGHQLIIPHIQSSDQTSYECVAENALGTYTRDYTVRVLSRIQLLRPLIDQTIREDAQVQLECRFLSQPPPDVTWYHVLPNGQSQAITANVRPVEDGSILVLPKVQRADAGQYICQADSGTEIVRFNATVDVLSPAHIDSLTGNGQVIVSKGQKVHLFCNSSSNPRPTVTWDAMINGNVYIDTDGSLVISNTQKSDQSNYSCTVKNILGTDHATITVIVQVPPEATIVPEATPAKVALVFDCEINGDPPLSVTWLKDGMPIDLQNKAKYMELPATGNSHKLVILHGDATDIGLYQCRVSNHIGTTTAFSSVYKDMGSLNCSAEFTICNSPVCGGHCPATCLTSLAAVYGDADYAVTSSICRAAIHNGVLMAGTNGTVIWQPHGTSATVGTIKNNIQSTSFNTTTLVIKFVGTSASGKP